MENFISLIVSASVVIAVGNFIGGPRAFAWTMNGIALVCIIVACLEVKKCLRKK